MTATPIPNAKGYGTMQADLFFHSLRGSIGSISPHGAELRREMVQKGDDLVAKTFDSYAEQSLRNGRGMLTTSGMGAVFVLPYYGAEMYNAAFCMMGAHATRMHRDMTVEGSKMLGYFLFGSGK